MSDMASLDMFNYVLKFPLYLSRLGISPFQVFDNEEVHT